LVDKLIGNFKMPDVVVVLVCRRACGIQLVSVVIQWQLTMSVKTLADLVC